MARWIERANRVLKNEPLTRGEAREILESSDAGLDDLLDGAFILRSRYHGRTVKIHVLLNAQSGLCPENCTFCSQSVHADSPTETYGLLSQRAMVDAAKDAKAAGAWKF